MSILVDCFLYIYLCFVLQLLNDEEFALARTSVVLVTALITPLIKLLHDPAGRLMTQIGRSTVQRNLMKNSTTPELRMMVCVRKHETVPSILNFLVVLVGRTAPLLVIDEDMKSRLSSSAMLPTSHKIISMINQYLRNAMMRK